ncbi:MAG: winged helix-turn-helix domain-containing protein, partial [Pseudomonadota bacterium]
MKNKLPELLELEQIIHDGAPHLGVQTACEVNAGPHRLPVYALTLGNPSPDVPAVGFFGGIHGLERIGTQVLLVFLRGLLARLRWDRMLHQQLESVRLIFMPLINPGGMWNSTRCNPNGVDLMRNAPVEARDPVPFLLGGQRISRHLPWFRGNFATPMELESAAVCRIVREELLPREFRLLEYMMRHPGIVLSRAMIMEHVWTADSDPFSNTVEAHIRNIR